VVGGLVVLVGDPSGELGALVSDLSAVGATVLAAPTPEAAVAWLVPHARADLAEPAAPYTLDGLVVDLDRHTVRYQGLRDSPQPVGVSGSGGDG